MKGKRAFGVAAAADEGLFAPQHPVIESGLSLNGHKLRPPPHDAVVLGEEAVSAYVHAVPVMANRPRYSSQGIARFQYGDIVHFCTVFQKLISRGKSRGTSAYNNYFFHSVPPLEL